MLQCYVLMCARSVTAFLAPPRSLRPGQGLRLPHPKAGPMYTDSVHSPDSNFRISDIPFLSKVSCRYYAFTFHFKTIILYKPSIPCVTTNYPPDHHHVLTFWLSAFIVWNVRCLYFIYVFIVSCLDVLSLLVSVTLKSSCDLVCLWKVVVSHFSFLWRFDPTQGHVLPLRGFTVTLTGHTTPGSAPQDEWLARRRDLYMANIHHSRKTNIHTPAGFEPTFLASEKTWTTP
jgi:hypothetical protein